MFDDAWLQDEDLCQQNGIECGVACLKSVLLLKRHMTILDFRERSASLHNVTLFVGSSLPSKKMVTSEEKLKIQRSYELNKQKQV